MHRERILITVKTYPTLSQSHIELVCTAGLREDGSWVRIYPIPFRLLEQKYQFPKWTWVELPLMRRRKDRRPESYSPTDRHDISVMEPVSTKNEWRERRKLLFKKSGPWTSLSRLIEAGKKNELSLAVFKPSRMLSFEVERTEPSWDIEKLSAVEAQLRQDDLLEPQNVREDFNVVRKLPYHFYYRFEDETGRTSRLRILDWELGMLFWNCRRSSSSEEEVLQKVRLTYEQKFFQKDLHLLLGTTLEWHDRAPNPWIVVGVVPFPHQLQQDFFPEI